MKLYVIQEHVRGPWRWAITDDEDRVIAKSAIAYVREGWAMREMSRAIHLALANLDDEKIQVVPSVQLDLFKNEKFKR